MSREMFRDFLYLRLYSCYREDLDIYHDINEVKDYNNDIIKTVTSTVDRQLQGHAQFCVTFNIFVCIRVIETISVSISTLLRPRIKMVIYVINTATLGVVFKFKVTHYFE